jgi:acetyl esterase/lipase
VRYSPPPAGITPTPTAREEPTMRRSLRWGLGIVACIGVLGVALFETSPWPSAWLLGRLMDDQGDASALALQRHVPDGIASRLDLRYGSADDERFDLFAPAHAGAPLTAIVWVHGGGFIAGDKEAVANYLRILAARGFAAIGLEYSKGRGHAYPQPVAQVNAALAHLVAHAGELGIDADRLVLAGDSAGAQIAAQVALVATDADYAHRLGIQPGVDARRLRALALVSGAFDLSRIRYDGEGAWIVNTFLWAYTGKRRYLDDPRVMLASINQHVDARFPPSFVASGNGDPLEPQARRLVARLAELGIPHAELFFAPDHSPAQPHEFQFTLDTAEGRQALEAMVAFLRPHVDATR